MPLNLDGTLAPGCRLLASRCQRTLLHPPCHVPRCPPERYRRSLQQSRCGLIEKFVFSALKVEMSQQRCQNWLRQAGGGMLLGLTFVLVQKVP